jgi:rhodanese-related sulfurtransferase
MTRGVTPAELRAMLADGGEIALIDVREELIFAQDHILLARSIPLSRIELRFATLVPRRGTRIVLCDDNDGLAGRAAALLDRNGYGNVAVLDGGVGAWRAAGYELFSGVNVPSKAFGEYIEHHAATPGIDAADLERLIGEGADLVVLDSRPRDEFNRVSIPTATNVPGAELVLRAREIAPSPDTLVVVNCAGRTRSIIGAQSLINAGLPNKVAALRNGTMGWRLAGFACDHGKDRPAPPASAAARHWAQQASARVAERFGIDRVEAATIEAWRLDPERTLYLFDVRDPVEYEAGHVAGAVSAPGGQLVQATDQYVGTLNARIVLIDDLAVRAEMTASWLKQMGHADVHVWVTSGDERGRPRPNLLEAPQGAVSAAIDCATLHGLLAHDRATVIDLSPSRDYRTRHIPGAWFAIRTRLAKAFETIPPARLYVLTSEDGALARLVVDEAKTCVKSKVRFLAGGNAAWDICGFEVSTEARLADEAIDQWRKPYERSGDTEAAMRDYLAWEVDLLPRVERDGTVRFLSPSPSPEQSPSRSSAPIELLRRAVLRPRPRAPDR